jgi:hypothetical protein
MTTFIALHFIAVTGTMGYLTGRGLRSIFVKNDDTQPTQRTKLSEWVIVNE